MSNERHKETPAPPNQHTINVPHIGGTSLFDPWLEGPDPPLTIQWETVRLGRVATPVTVRGNVRYWLVQAMGVCSDGTLYYHPMEPWQHPLDPPIPDRIWRRVSRIHPSTIWNRLQEA